MKMVPIKEAKDKLTALARRVEAGERITVTRNGKPAFDMVPHKPSGGIDFEGLKQWKAERGLPEMIVRISDDFDDPLPEDFLLRPLP